MSQAKINNKYCKILISAFLLISIAFSCNAENSTKEESHKGINVQEMIFGHINDSYSWHITSIGGHKIEIPLLVIVNGQNGWNCFCSSKLEQENGYDGYYLSKGKQYEGKIVEVVNGEEKRPIDLSITKNILTLFMVGGLLLGIFLTIAQSYKKDPLSKPSGLQAYFEPVILAIEDGVIKPCIGKNYKKYSAYIMTVFFFVLTLNLLGLVPIFPGGANLTGNIAITGLLAIITFILTNFTTNKFYWKDIFWPEVPIWLKFPLPIMQFIEIIGLLTKPVSLCVRLFANMLSGHIMQLVLVGLIFILTAKINAAVGAGSSVIAVGLAIFMDLLEVLVCLIQAYVFATLSSLFIGLAQERPETKEQ